MSGVTVNDTAPSATDALDLDILAVAREQVLDQGRGLDERQLLEVLELPDARIEELLALAHAVRERWCGPEVEVEGIVSVKTGGCPEDCHFCSQSGLFPTPVRAAWLDIPSLVEAAKQTAKSGATEFCIVAAVRGPDERLLAQVAAGIEAIRTSCANANSSSSRSSGSCSTSSTCCWPRPSPRSSTCRRATANMSVLSVSDVGRVAA